MPIIKVELFAGRTNEQKAAFTRAVTEIFVQVCGGTPQSVHVIFIDVQKSDWGVNGKMLSEPAAQ